MLVMLDVVLVLEPPTFTPIKLMLEETGTRRGLVHIIVISQHPLWCHIGVGIIQSKLPIFPHLVLQLVVVEAVLGIVPPTFTTRKYQHILVVKENSVLIVVLRRQK